LQGKGDVSTSTYAGNEHANVFLAVAVMLSCQGYRLVTKASEKVEGIEKEEASKSL